MTMKAEEQNNPTHDSNWFNSLHSRDLKDSLDSRAWAPDRVIEQTEAGFA